MRIKLASVLVGGLFLLSPAALAQTEMPDLPGSNVVAGSLPEEARQPRAARQAQADNGAGTGAESGLGDLPGVGALPDDTLNAAEEATGGNNDPAPSTATTGNRASSGGNLPSSGAPVAAMAVIGAWMAILGGIFATWARLVRRARPAL
jgi:hypothetical protein